MKTEHIIIGAFIIVFLGLTAMVIVKGVQVQAYQQGINDGMFFVNNQILDDLKTNGFITFSWVENNQTQRINLAPVQS